MLLRWVALSVSVYVSSAVTCYDCYNTGPDYKDCTRERSCKGTACMIFDAGDNQTATAFCLLAMKGDEKIDKSSGCWLEPDGRGKHCMCHTDYCNRLVDRRGEKNRGPLVPLLPDAQFLKQNPLIDYDSPNFEDDSEDGAAPPPENVLFPAAVKADPVTSGDNDDDLTPIDFDEYDKEIMDKDNDQSSHRKSPSDIASAVPPLPSWVLMTLTMAASWARLLLSL